MSMLIERAPAMTQLEVESLRSSVVVVDGRPRWPRALAFLIAFGAVLAYALRGSGSYYLLTRQEEGLVVWWVLALGIAFGLLPRRRPSRLALLVLCALLAYAGWIALSLIWTPSAERTTAELARALDYAGVVGLVGAALDRDSWRAAALGLAAGVLTVSCLALISRLHPSAFGIDAAGLVFGSSRLSYPFGYWNAVGAWGAMSTAIALGYSACERARLRRTVALALLPLVLASTYLTYSRAAIAGTAVAVIAVVGLSRHRWTAVIHAGVGAIGAGIVIETIRREPQIAHGTGAAGAGGVASMLVLAAVLGALGAVATGAAGTDRLRLPRRGALALAGVCALGLLGAGVAFGPRIASQAWSEFRHPKIAHTADPAARLNRLNGTRYQLWKVGLQAFDADPLTGTGAGTFELWWDRHATEAEFVRNAHSLWIESMAELGLPGLLAIVAVAAGAIAIGVTATRRARRSSSVAPSVALSAAFLVFLLQASVDWMWQSTAVTVVALAGIAILAARLSGRPAVIRRRARIAIALLAAIAGAVQVPGLISTAEIGRSQAAERRGDGATALAWANVAVQAQPWAASPYTQRGLVLERAGRLAAAGQDLQRAISRESGDYRLWVILARIETERGRLGQAAADYERARQLRPYSVVFGRQG